MKIVAAESAYEYINGAFRPDTEKLLQMLSGTALYGNPLQAVRELLQNSFDAVRERIGYMRLAQPSPSDPRLASTLGELHTVSLSLEADSDGLWLVCLDNGVGMTRSIIENHLLVSGTGGRHDVLDLERRCSKEGFLLGRTGQFGIGVLSYFMIADRVIIRTKRSQEPGDSEETGWRFETAGVGSFGELMKQSGISPGTTIRLRLREDIVAGKPVEWFNQLTTFLTNTLQHIPCKFQLSTTLPGTMALSFKPGWCRPREFFAGELLREIKAQEYSRNTETPEELLSSARKKEIEVERQYLEVIRDEVSNTLEWKEFDGELPDGAGRVRIHVPYFTLVGHASLGYLRIAKKGRDLIANKIVKGYMFVPACGVYESWKGMIKTNASGRTGRH
jgi:hypothetical protein